MDYKEQIKHPKWQKKRLEILEENNWTCAACGNTDAQLHVHHTRYEKNKMIWDYSNYKLMAVCNECHKEIHRIKDSIKEIIDINHTNTYSLKLIHDIILNISKFNSFL